MTDKQFEELKELLKQIAEQLFQLNNPNTSFEWDGNKLKVLEHFT